MTPLAKGQLGSHRPRYFHLTRRQAPILLFGQDGGKLEGAAWLPSACCGQVL